MKESPLVRQPELLVWFLFTDVSRIIRQLVDVEMRGLGLTRAQWYLLTHTYYYEGMRQQELADLMDLGKSSTAKLIHKLEAKKWIQREGDPSDARIAKVSLTPNVRSVVRDLSKLCGLGIRHVFEDLTEQEVEQLVATLRKIERTLAKPPAQTPKELGALRAKLAATLQQESIKQKSASRKLAAARKSKRRLPVVE